jgi:hypothetical protein
MWVLLDAVFEYIVKMISIFSVVMTPHEGRAGCEVITPEKIEMFLP